MAAKTNLFVTWSSSLDLLNCLLVLDRSEKNISVTVEPDFIQVECGDSQRRFVIPGISLQPETCRGLTLVSSEELQFSIKGSKKGDDIIQARKLVLSCQNKTVEVVKKVQNKWYCASCRIKLLDDWCVFSRILPLPSENWADFTDMWFCHNHGECNHGDANPNIENSNHGNPKQNSSDDNSCDSENHQESENHSNYCNGSHSNNCHGNQKMKFSHQRKLLPKKNECFVGETFLLVSKQNVDSGSVNVTKSGAVQCRRCRRQFGEVVAAETDGNADNAVVRFYLQDLLLKDLMFEDLVKQYVSEDKQQDASSFFSQLLLEQSDTYASFRFIVESSSETDKIPLNERSTCLLWLLEPGAVEFRSQGILPEDGDSCVTLKRSTVLKVMFKCQLHCPNRKRSPDYVTKTVISSWRKDNTVHGFQLPHPVLLQLVNLLIHNCKQLPKSQRYLNGFHVSFIEREVT